MLNSLAIATQGLGFGVRALAAQGFLEAVEQPRRPGNAGGRLVGLNFKMARPKLPRDRRRDDVLLLKP